MLPIVLYSLSVAAALVWCLLVSYPTGAFEFLRSNLHATARGMGKYGEWLSYSLWRFTALSMFVVVSVATSAWFFIENPEGFTQSTRIALLGAMIVGALAVYAMPFVAAWARFKIYLYLKSTALSELVSIAGSDVSMTQRLQPAEYDSVDCWTAWHPKESDWQVNGLWEGLVPVAYIRREPEPSVIVPVDWDHFLTWKLPAEIRPACLLPIRGPWHQTFTVKSVRKLVGRQEWSVVRAGIDG